MNHFKANNSKRIKKHRARFLLNATYSALAALVFAPSTAMAANECGTGPTVTCNNTGTPYTNGINYTGTDVNLTVAAGTVINTTGGTLVAPSGNTTVGIGLGVPAVTTAGNASLTVESGASITIAQNTAYGLVIRGSSGASTGTLVNNGSVSMLGTGGRAIYVFTNGDVSVTNSASGELNGAAAFGIFAQDAGVDHTVNVINDGTIALTAAGSTGIRGVARGTTGTVSIAQGGTVAAEGIGVELQLGTAGSSGTFQNTGSITGGTGVSFTQGVGTVTATNSGSVTGTTGSGMQVSTTIVAAIDNTGTITGQAGVTLLSDGNTLTNSGAIIGAAGTAISVAGSNNAVNLNDGSSITGDAISSGTANTLLLQGSGTITGDIAGFSDLTVSGNLWQVGGDVSTTAGSTTIASGTLQIGTGGTTGSITDDVVNRGVLAFNRSDNLDYAGVVSGSGGLSQIGSGTTTLTGINTYSGATQITAGTLAAGAADVFSPASSYTVGAGGTMELNGFNQTVNSIANAGQIRISGAPGARLTVGNYVGNNGTIALNTYLGADDSASDRLVIDGGTATGSTTLLIANSAGSGALTTANGIQVVEASNGATTAANAFKLNDPIVAGAYEYSLYRGGLGADANSQDWYLRSIDTTSAGGPEGEALTTSAQTARAYAGQLSTYALSTLGTLQQRTGHRIWMNGTNAGNDSGSSQQNASNSAGSWGRVGGQYSSYDPKKGTPYTQSIGFLQTGYEGTVLGNDHGVFNAGLFATIGTSHADLKLTDNPVTGAKRNSKIDITGYSMGANATWLGNKGFYADLVGQVTWYDNKLSNKTNGHNSGWSTASSLEIGQRFEMNAEWNIVPQAQLAWTHVDFKGFTDEYGAQVSQADGDSLTGRIGVQVETLKNWQGTNGKVHHLQLYGIANLGYELFADNKVNVADLILEQDNPKLWGELGVGGSYSWRSNWSAYGEASYATALSSHGGDKNYTLKGTVGMRYRW